MAKGKFGSLRIISGLYRGRKIDCPSGKKVRPTAERIREALFSMLGEGNLQGAKVADLFAGSGALGIEALSRGAQSCFFVEAEKTVFQQLQDNCRRLEIIDKCYLHWRKTPEILQSCQNRFDLVFLDPPYSEGELLTETMAAIDNLDILQKNGIIVVETTKKLNLEIPPSLSLFKERIYGETQISLIKRVITK